MRVIGLDPSMANLGIAIGDIDEKGNITISDLKLVETDGQNGKTVRKNSDDIRRCRLLYRAMHEACSYGGLVIAEVPVGSQSSRAMASYGMCAMLLAACPRPLIEVTPNEVKLASVGSKLASKEEVIDWAFSLYPNAPWLVRNSKGKKTLVKKNEHLADAIAAIHAGVQTEQFRALAEYVHGSRMRLAA